MPLVSQRVVAIKDKDDLYHRVEIGIRHTVREDKGPEHRSVVLTTVRRGSHRGSSWRPMKTSGAIKYLDIYRTRK